MKRFMGFLALVLVIGVGWYFYQLEDRKQSKVAEVLEPQNSETPKWREILTNDLANPGERSTALVKLAQAKDSLALEFAKKWLYSSSEIEREAAIQALPLFDDKEVIERLKENWVKLSEIEKIHLLKALVENPSQSRKTWLAELGTDLSTPDGILARFLIQRSAAGLIEPMGRLPEVTQQRLLGLLVLRAPSDLGVIDWLIELADNSPSESMRAFAIRNIGMAKAKKYSPQLKKLAHSKVVDIRSAVLEVIPQLCPTDRWEIMNETARKESNQLVLRRLLDSLSYLKGKDANQILQIVQNREASLITALKPKIDETKKDLEGSHIANRCDRQ